ncbi:MAG: hypothetical protein M4579_001500 [Chaenotheca gracillima]|nr:MAG: hypothetical protein M4579_001500 [Chaenotheca gracillima]
MPWRPLRRIAFAVAIYPFQASSAADLPLELGDELYIIEQGGVDGAWYRGYLVAPPSLLAGLTSVKGQTLEARVFSGIFPRSCVEVREVLGEHRTEGERKRDTVDTNGREKDGEDGDVASSRSGLSIRTKDGTTNGHGHGRGGDASPHRSDDERGGSDHDPQRPSTSRSVKRKLSSKHRSNKTTSTSTSASAAKRKKGKRRDDGGGLELAHSASIHSSASQRSRGPASPWLADFKIRDPQAPKPPAPVPMLKVGDETPTSAEEPLVDEIASCLREWHSTNLHELLLTKQYSLVHKTASFVQQLDFARRQLLHNVLTNHELEKLRRKVVWDLVNANKMLSGEVVVRDPDQRGRILTGDDSAVQITKLQSIMSLLDKTPTHIPEPSMLHHLLLSLRPATKQLAETPTLEFFLCAKPPGGDLSALSEVFLADGYGQPATGKASINQTLFTELSALDVGAGPNEKSQLYLVVKVKRDKVLPSSSAVENNGPALPRTASTAKRTNQGAGSLAPSGTVKSGRRSLMWPQKSPGTQRGRNAQQYQSALPTSREEQPPNSADSGSSSPGVNGGLNSSPTSNRDYTPSQRTAKQVIGVGILRVDPLLQADHESTHTLSIWTPTTHPKTHHESQDTWNELIEEIMPSSTGQYAKSSPVEQVQVQLNSFLKSDADMLITETPTLLQNVVQTKKIGFSGAPTKPRSDVYVTISQAVLPRHALLSHPKIGSMQFPQTAPLVNLQVSFEVRTASGEAVEKCIFPSSNGVGVTTYETDVVDRQSPWDATVKLSIPSDIVDTCHLVALVSDAPGPPFAMSWMPLWDQQAFMRDGTHSPLLYRYDEWTSHPTASSMGKRGYLSFPWNSRGKDDLSKDEAVTGPLATLRLRTYLCSTVFSQDKVLIGLLKWRDQLPGDLMEILKRVIFVPEIEIVKLLSEVFDSLFGILVEQAGNDDYEDLVFSALVTVLGIVHDRRFNVGPLVDQYAESRFKYPFATPCLIRSFTRLLSNPAGMESSRKLRATFKVGRHILKFIIHAREQQKVKEAGIGITSTQPTFARELQSIFKALEALMRNPVPTLVGSQTLAVQHFHTWIPELMGFLDSGDILRIAIGFMESCSNVQGKLVLYRLILLINYAQLDLFAEEHARRTLVINTTRWLAPLWGKTEDVSEQWREQARLCCSVLASQMESLGDEVTAYVPKVIDSYRAVQATERHEKSALSLLFPKTYPFPTRPLKKKAFFDEALLELAAILGSLCCLPKPITLHFPELEAPQFLRDALMMHSSILNCDAFPSNWTSVHMYHHRSSLKTLECLGKVLMDSFVPEPDDAEDFDTDLWQVFFATLFKLVGSDALTLETFPEQKRRAAWQIAGDVREQGANLLRRSWKAIGWETSPDDQKLYGLERMGGYQVQYVPGLVPEIIELCLSVHGGLRNVAVEVLQSMIVSEWTLNQDLSVIQAEMIDCLDRLFKSRQLDESILQSSFTTELNDLFEPLSRIPDDPLYASLRNLLDTIDEFLDLLVAAHMTDISGEASTIMHTLRLMEFLRDMQKVDIFIRYVHQLAQLQARSRNFAEAGLALRFHADLYEWDPMKTLEALDDPDFVQQSAFERKESLYFEIIKHYEDAESWSMALAAYKELSEQYEHNVFDFLKLARTQRAMAKVHEAIAKGQRQTPRYFRVVYQGMGFPSGVRDKQFIFEGSPSERLSAFVDRMQEQYPSARLAPSGEIEDVEGQFLQISVVSPQRDMFNPVFRRLKIPQPTRDYLLFCHPTQFLVTSRRAPNGSHVKDQWVDKLVYITAEPFPTILKRSEIVSTSEVRLSPIQNAIERTTRKTQELVATEKRVTDGSEADLPALLEAIRVSVDTTSETTVARYRDLVPSEEEGLGEETIEDSEGDVLEVALKVALTDHALALRRCLGLCAKMESAQYGVSQADIYRDFHITYAPEIAGLAATTHRPPSIQHQNQPLSLSMSTSAHNQHHDNDLALSPQQSTISYPPPTLGILSPSSDAGSKSRAAGGTAGHEKNRLSLSFLKRAAGEPTTPGTPGPKMNGSSTARHDEGAEQQQYHRRGSRGRLDAHSTVDAEPTHSPNLGASGTRSNGASTGSGGGGSGSGGGRRRSTSSSRDRPRPKTSASHASTVNSTVNPTANAKNGVGGSGKVKKRFSMLKMGKKDVSGGAGNRSNTNVDSVREE